MVIMLLENDMNTHNLTVHEHLSVRLMCQTSFGKRRGAVSMRVLNNVPGRQSPSTHIHPLVSSLCLLVCSCPLTLNS